MTPSAFIGALMAFAGAGCLAAVVGPASGPVDGTSPATRWQANPAGIGHVNLVPYYAVLGGFDTYLNLSNTDTRNGKAVKLRFRAADNGDTVFDMTVLLSPGDQWAAAITRDTTTGLPRLVHGDKTCTLPADVKQLFHTARLNPSTQLSAADRAALASAGSVELITMADIPPRTGALDPPLFTAIRQVNGVAPCTGSALAPLADDALSYADAQARGLEVPTTGLMTRWTLINVPRAVAYTGVATALEARLPASTVAGYGNLVLSPQTAVAMGSLASVRRQTADPLLRGGLADNRINLGSNLAGVPAAVPAKFSDLPDLSTPYLPAHLAPNLAGGIAPRLQVIELSRALAVTSLGNEFVLDPGIQARTDWLIALPTLRYNAAVDHAAGAVRYTHWAADDSGNALVNVSNSFTPDLLAPGLPLCVIVDKLPSGAPPEQKRRADEAFFDPEGKADMHKPEVSLPEVPPRTLCGTASLLRFALAGGNPPSPVLPAAAPPSWQLQMRASAGWGRLALPGLSGLGVPALGFSAVELFNAAAAPGMAGAYGLSFGHSSTPANPPQ